MTAFAVNMSNIGTGSNASRADHRRQVVDAGGARAPHHDHGGKGPEGPAQHAAEAVGEGAVPDSHPSAGRTRTTCGSAFNCATPGRPAAGRRTAHRAGGRPLHRHGGGPHQPRTIDYPFTLFEIRVNKDGKGEGKLAYRDQDPVRQGEEGARARELLQRTGATAERRRSSHAPDSSAVHRRPLIVQC